MQDMDFDLQGHRGARGLMPENTLPAFARALEIGVSTLELDCGITADDVVVVHHDLRLNPDITRCDGRWLSRRGPAIRSLRYEELTAYDVGAIRPGSAYARRFPAQQPLEGVRIPRLADLFALVAASQAGHVHFNIETKIDPTQPALTVDPAAFARALVAEIRTAGLNARAIIQSFDWRTLAVVQQEAPDIRTAYLSSQALDFDTVRPVRDRASPWTNGLHFYDFRSLPKMVGAAGGHIWSPRHEDLDTGLIQEAHELGLQVIPWTVNEPGDMARLIDWGVDGLITDYPDRLREVMAAKRLALPPAVRAASA